MTEPPHRLSSCWLPRLLFGRAALVPPPSLGWWLDLPATRLVFPCFPPWYPSFGLLLLVSLIYFWFTQLLIGVLSPTTCRPLAQYLNIDIDYNSLYFFYYVFRLGTHAKVVPSHGVSMLPVHLFSLLIHHCHYRSGHIC